MESESSGDGAGESRVLVGISSWKVPVSYGPEKGGNPGIGEKREKKLMMASVQCQRACERE